MIKKNEEYIVDIMDNGFQGEGIAKIENFTVFIPNCLKGEKVKILIVKVLKSYAFGKIIEILEGKTGLIYFGFPECPWCRSILPVLEEAAIENKVAEIAYLNIENIRDVLELDENEKIVTTKEGSNNYYRILKLLDDYLEEYTLTDEEGNEIKTGEKRLYAPTVVAVSNGKIVGFHSGSIETQKNGYEPLTAKEKEELKKIYTDMIEKMSEGTCNEGC